jgi:transcriptional regulator with XRE-family HTH domain
LAGQDWVSRTLRELRADAGLSGSRAAAAAGLSQPRISRIESGVSVATETEIRTLCRLYKAPAATRRELLRAAEDMRAEVKPARVAIQRGTAHKLQERIARIEADSAEIGVYQPALVPGLLQTPRYMRAVFSDGGDITGEDLERSVEARSARTAVLNSRRQFTFIMAEGALRWQAMNPEVMAEQLDHLATLASRLRIGVIPWTRPATVFTTHGFSIYDRRTVILGTRTGTSFITSTRDVADYVKLFDALEALAEFGDEAAAACAAMAQEYSAL